MTRERSASWCTKKYGYHGYLHVRLIKGMEYIIAQNVQPFKKSHMTDLFISNQQEKSNVFCVLSEIKKLVQLRTFVRIFSNIDFFFLKIYH